MANSAPCDWLETTLGEFTTLQRGIDLPEQDRRPGRVPIIGSFGLTGWHDESRVAGPGVVVGRSGASFGVVSYVDEDYWPLNTSLYVKDFHGNDPRFAYYFLRMFPFKQFNSGSAQPSLNRNFVHPVGVVAPPLPEQHRIAAILGALDDKIDLNRRMNRTLEEMAQAIFKSWFIDFDGYTDLVDSELGPIPRGWRVGSLDDVARNVRDGAAPSELPPETPYVGLEHIPRKCAALESWGASAEVESGKSRFARGDVLFGKLRPYFHKVVIAPLDGVCSTDILVVRPKQPSWLGFAFGHLFSTALVDHASAMADGTKMPRTRWADLNRYQIAVSPEPVARAFDTVVRPMYDRIGANVFESKTLAALRDTLLPKLISGEVRVPEAERIAEEAL